MTLRRTPASDPLARALADARERDLAVASDDALVRYQARWERRIGRLQGAHPERWRVPGLSEEEVRDALTLALIEAVRTGPVPHGAPRADGKEWGLSVVERQLADLRRRFRLDATPVDMWEVTLVQRTPSQEETLVELQEEERRVLASRSAEADLSRPQRRWLAAMHVAAERGEFFEASDQLNLSAASRLLGKHRSSAKRAYTELQAQFQRARARLG